MYYKIDDDGEKVWCRQFTLVVCGYKEEVREIDSEILKLLNNKSFKQVNWSEGVNNG